jgi:hypothetical protein
VKLEFWGRAYMERKVVCARYKKYLVKAARMHIFLRATSKENDIRRLNFEYER